MEKQRCGWCESSKLYRNYHDKEWGVPVTSDRLFFEFLVLETFQAGLSWITVLKKREHFRAAFDNFKYEKIAAYPDKKIESLLQNKNIIRHKLKINAAVNNAQCFMEIRKEFGSFSQYIWPFVQGKPLQNKVENYKNIAPTTPISDALSKDLKKRGFKFTGSTVMYAFMQATGLVNDHETSCFRYKEVKKITAAH